MVKRDNKWTVKNYFVGRQRRRKCCKLFINLLTTSFSWRFVPGAASLDGLDLETITACCWADKLRAAAPLVWHAAPILTAAGEKVASPLVRNVVLVGWPLAATAAACDWRLAADRWWLLAAADSWPLAAAAVWWKSGSTSWLDKCAGWPGWFLKIKWIL